MNILRYVFMKVHTFKILFVSIVFLFANNFFLSAQDSSANTFDKYNNQHLGLFAPNFRIVIDSMNDTLSLYDIKTDTLIILFYDPDCSHCKKEIKKLKKDKFLNQSIAYKRSFVLTIPPDITFSEWEKVVKRLPKNWINAWSLDNDLIIKKYLWKVPEIFVLDKDKHIIDINMFREDYDDK